MKVNLTEEEVSYIIGLFKRIEIYGRSQESAHKKTEPSISRGYGSKIWAYISKKKAARYLDLKKCLKPGDNELDDVLATHLEEALERKVTQKLIAMKTMYNKREREDLLKEEIEEVKKIFVTYDKFRKI